MLRTAIQCQRFCRNGRQTILGLIELGQNTTTIRCQQTAPLSDYSQLRKPSADDGIFELKMCRLKPQFVDDFKQLKNATNEQYNAHVSPLWYWFSEFGGLNEVVSLWKYDSYAERSHVQKALISDTALKEDYFSKAKPMLRNQTNLIMHQCPWYQMQFPDKPGVYELGTYSIQSGKFNQVVHRLVQGLETRMKYSKPVGFFLTDIGPLSRLIVLWHYEDLDQRDKIREASYADEMWSETIRDINVYVQDSSNKILVPASFSPRQ
eukprot:gene12727-14032_t